MSEAAGEQQAGPSGAPAHVPGGGSGPPPGMPGRRRRAPGGRALSAVAPGLPQLLAGRWGSGGGAFLVWAGFLAIATGAHARLDAALSGGWDERLAVLTLAAGLAASWAWSWRDLGATPPEPGAGVSRWGLTVRSFSRNRVAVLGLMVVVAFYLVAFLAPLLTPFDPVAQGPLGTSRFLPPSVAHPLGTDQYARDVLSRILYGARISLSIGLLAAGIAIGIGTVVGAVAGYLGGVVDTGLMRVVDMILSFPRLVLLITLAAVFEPGMGMVVGVLGLTLWPGTARLVRGEVLSLKEREFVEAARALGYSRRRIIFRHLIPNALAPVIVAATLGVGNVIVLEAGLSFLGLGVQPPTPSWGVMVADGRGDLLDAWWVATFPGLAIVFTVLSFNLVGDGLRDAMDPRLGGGGG